MNQLVTVRFDLIWRAGANDTILAAVTHTFEPPPSGGSVAFDADLDGAAAAAAPGDLLVLRFTTVGGAATTYYIPNGDGELAGARDPNVTLPVASSRPARARPDR